MCLSIIFTTTFLFISGIILLAGAGVGAAASGVLRVRRENTLDESDTQDEKKMAGLAPLIGIAAALFLFLPRGK